MLDYRTVISPSHKAIPRILLVDRRLKTRAKKTEKREERKRVFSFLSLSLSLLLSGKKLSEGQCLPGAREGKVLFFFSLLFFNRLDISNCAGSGYRYRGIGSRREAHLGNGEIYFAEGWPRRCTVARGEWRGRAGGKQKSEDEGNKALGGRETGEVVAQGWKRRGGSKGEKKKNANNTDGKKEKGEKERPVEPEWTESEKG